MAFILGSIPAVYNALFICVSLSRILTPCAANSVSTDAVVGTGADGSTGLGVDPGLVVLAVNDANARAINSCGAGEPCDATNFAIALST